jgi:7-cyano-7-deazaguanine synthase
MPVAKPPNSIPDDTAALVLFSGGQDSTTCLAWALQRYSHVYTVGFDYGQRHKIELEARQAVLNGIRSQFPQWVTRLGSDEVLDLTVLGQISQTALTRSREITLLQNGLPNTFVPGRNLLFFTLAAALAYRIDAQVLVGGMCETDFSGYPDCRENTIKALEQAIALGMDSHFVLETPLMHINKAQSFALAQALGGEALIDILLEHTHTCYLGERGQRFDWGYGCGNCPACVLRKNGFVAWQNTAPAV